MAVFGFSGAERGCGYPQVGGIYLVSKPLGATCDRLPMELPICPVCGEHVRFSRSMQQINPLKLFDEHKGCKDKFKCPACQPEDVPAGLMWAGDAFYSPDEFIREAAEMGISKRIAVMPSFFKVGKTWLFIAHKKALQRDGKSVPAIICVTKPSQLLKVMKESDITDEKVKEYEERGIDIMSVPDGDDRFTSGAKSKKSRKKHPLDFLVEG